MDYKSLCSRLIGIVVIFFVNILLMPIIFWRNTRRVEKAVSLILTGIETIAGGKTISFPEQGELTDINAEQKRL